MKFDARHIAAAAAVAALAAGPGSALAAGDGNAAGLPRADGRWISVSGEIAEVSEETFQLEHGDGTLTVETAEGLVFRNKDAPKKGDKVIVYGEVDNGLFENRTVEATSIYSKTNNTYYYVDRERPARFPTVGVPSWRKPPIEQDPDRGEITLSGVVESVDGRDLVIDMGGGTMTADTGELGYDPTDDQGRPKIEEGDRVQVTGRLDEGFFTDEHVTVESLTKLEDAGSETRTKKTGKK